MAWACARLCAGAGGTGWQMAVAAVGGVSGWVASDQNDHLAGSDAGWIKVGNPTLMARRATSPQNEGKLSKGPLQKHYFGIPTPHGCDKRLAGFPGRLFSRNCLIPGPRRHPIKCFCHDGIWKLEHRDDRITRMPQVRPDDFVQVCGSEGGRQTLLDHLHPARKHASMVDGRGWQSAL